MTKSGTCLRSSVEFVWFNTFKGSFIMTPCNILTTEDRVGNQKCGLLWHPGHRSLKLRWSICDTRLTKWMNVSIGWHCALGERGKWSTAYINKLHHLPLQPMSSIRKYGFVFKAVGLLRMHRVCYVQYWYNAKSHHELFTCNFLNWVWCVSIKWNFVQLNLMRYLIFDDESWTLIQVRIVGCVHAVAEGTNRP